MTAVAGARNDHQQTPPVVNYARKNARQLPASPDSQYDSLSSQSSWQSADTWQHSPSRLIHSGSDRRALEIAGPTAASPSGRHGQATTEPYQLPNRSSSAVSFRNSAIDVEFPTQPVPLHRPVPLQPTKSPARTTTTDRSSALGSDAIRHLANDAGASSKTSLTRRLGNVYRRRSESANNSVEKSPVVVGLDLPPRNKESRSRRYSTDSSDSQQDTKNVKKSKNGKVKSAKRILPFRRKTEDITLERTSTGKVVSDSNHHVISSPDSATGSHRHVDQRMSADESSTKSSSSPVKREAYSLPSTSSTSSSLPCLDKQIYGEEKLSSKTPSTPVKTRVGSTSGTPISQPVETEATAATPSIGTENGNQGRQGAGIDVENGVLPGVKLPTTPVTLQYQKPLDTPTKDNTVSRPQHLRIQLNSTEQAIVAKRYGGPSAADQAVADINQLMTCHVTTPISSPDVISASDSDLVRCSGSKTPNATSSLDSGSDEAVDGSRPRLVESSFRRAELLPTVRRFIHTCKLLKVAATSADRAAEFDGFLTDSVHAFVTVLAVSRRATYGQTGRDQITDALRMVAQSYCDMVTAAGSAVGLPDHDPSTKEASKKAASLAICLSSLLQTVKYLKANKVGSRIVYF